ncbi:hypothetical protein P7C73_g2978, partial [Tremellales sp. Uapishka_1]
MQNDPETLFPTMAQIVSRYPDWETLLAPRLILGLWHPLFIRPAYQYLPLLRRYHIGVSVDVAKKYFWDACEGFSMLFAVMMGAPGEKFREECRQAGKEVTLWTVNSPEEMKIGMSWGVKAVLTDKVVADPAKLQLPGWSSYTYGWSNWKYYTAFHVGIHYMGKAYLSTNGRLVRPGVEGKKPP